MKIGMFLGNAGRNSGGPEIYERELVRSMTRLAPENEYHLFCLDRRGPAIVGAAGDNVHYHSLWPSLRAVAMSGGLQWSVFCNPTDVLHATFMPPTWMQRPYALTLVCFSMFRHPEFYPPAIRLRLQALVRIGVKAGRFFLCVSENVRDLFVEKFGIPVERTAVTWMGASPRFRPCSSEEIEDARSRYGIRDPYMIYSGRWEHRKNIVRIIEAFALFKRETRLPHKLVCSGGKTWAATEAEAAIDRLGISGDVIDTGKDSLEHLPALYSGADALLYPSLWEGFGMPIAEAMACGTPVITGSISSMPEVAGGAALLVDPYSTPEIADAMRRIAGSADLRNDLSRRGLERAALFSWDLTARRTLAAYHRIAEAA